MAEGQGFEPWVPLGTSVFKTGAFSRSATPPLEERNIRDLGVHVKFRMVLKGIYVNSY